MDKVLAQLEQMEHDSHMAATLAWLGMNSRTLGYNEKKRLPKTICQQRAKAAAYRQVAKMIIRAQA